MTAEGLVKRFGDVEALAGVDLEIPTGQVLGLLGPNGAGKTTTVRILATLLRADAGTAQVAGHDVRTDPAGVRRCIGLSGQFTAVDESITGRENVVMFARLVGLSKAEAIDRARRLIDRFGLTEAADRPPKGYSGGMRRRLDLASALVGDPAVVVLDEPTTGLDPRGRMETWDLVGSLVADGSTVLLTTQYLEEADRLADSIAVIDRGRVVAHDTADRLKQRVGGERLRVVTAADELDVVERTLTAVGIGPARIDRASLTGSVAVTDGVNALVETVQQLGREGVTLQDIGLERPTLDDVFLALTTTTGREPVDTVDDLGSSLRPEGVVRS